jgi:hypothetical protein
MRLADLEMCRPRDRVQAMEIIGQHTTVEQAFAEREQCARIVVDAA